MRQMGFSITETTASAAVPAGKRKIALVARSNGRDNSDYHFYMRHSNGTWSHKRGSLPITNRLIDTNVVLTDSNISAVAQEGGYENGLGFFLIGKDAVTDYPHDFGQGSELYTPARFKDKAGDSVSACTTMNGASMAAKFDYPGDQDWYLFVPSRTATYTIGATIADSSTSRNVRGYVWDDDGVVASNTTGAGRSLVFSLTLTAGKSYYICVYESNNTVVDYTFSCYTSSPIAP